MDRDYSFGGPKGLNHTLWAAAVPVLFQGTMQSDGYVWYGNGPVDHEAKQGLWAILRLETKYKHATDQWLEDNIHIDPHSMVGALSQNYSYFELEHNGHRHPKGGPGSHAYMYQNVGVGVHFFPYPVFYRALSGEYIKGIPPNAGAVHIKDVTGEGDLLHFEGPMPDSEAAKRLGGGHYKWNAAKQLYEIIEGPLKGGRHVH